MRTILAIIALIVGMAAASAQEADQTLRFRAYLDESGQIAVEPLEDYTGEVITGAAGEDFPAYTAGTEVSLSDLPEVVRQALVSLADGARIAYCDSPAAPSSFTHGMEISASVGVATIAYHFQGTWERSELCR